MVPENDGMDMAIFKALGIDEKAAAIYLATLLLGTTSVQHIARKSGLKRPTVYLHLDDLIKQGLIEHVPLHKKNYYRATDPVVIEDRLKKNLSTFQAQMPRMQSLRADTMGKPQVRLLEGQEGIKQVYEEIRKTNSFRVWSNVGQEYGPFHNTYMELAETIKEQGIGVREISANTKESRRYIRLIAKVAGPSYSVRMATVDGIENDTIIYGDVIALFRLPGLNQFVVRIEDKTMADTMRAMFDMAWKTARPFK